MNWLSNVTINDISVIYVTAQLCAGGLKKVLDLRLGSQRHRHFVGLLTVPVHGTTLLNGYSEKPPHLDAFYDTLGIRRTHSRLPHGGLAGTQGFSRFQRRKYDTTVNIVRSLSSARKDRVPFSPSAAVNRWHWIPHIKAGPL